MWRCSGSTNRLRFGFCVLDLWGDRGGTYANICLLGLDDKAPIAKTTLELADTLGPHYTMLSREPADSVTLLRRDVGLPQRNREAFRAWNNLPVQGHATTRDDFPGTLRAVLPKLGWSGNSRG